MTLSRDSPLLPWKASGTLGGVPIFDSDSEGGYQNFMVTPRGGMRFLQALFPKRTTPPTRNSDQSLIISFWLCSTDTIYHDISYLILEYFVVLLLYLFDTFNHYLTSDDLHDHLQGIVCTDKATLMKLLLAWMHEMKKLARIWRSHSVIWKLSATRNRYELYQKQLCISHQFDVVHW